MSLTRNEKYLVLIVIGISVAFVWVVSGLYNEVMIIVYFEKLYGLNYNDVPQCHAQTLDKMTEIMSKYEVCIFRNSVQAGVDGFHLIMASCVWYTNGYCQPVLKIPDDFTLRVYDDKSFISISDWTESSFSDLINYNLVNGTTTPQQFFGGVMDR